LSIKKRVLALAAAAGLALTAGLAYAGTAGAATPSCGSGCIDIFSRDFGTFHNPNFVLDVYRGGANVGQKIILFKQSNSDAAEDFSAEFDGLTSGFYAAGLVSSATALHWGCTSGSIVGSNGQQIACSPGATDDPAGEIEYAPRGADSGLCVGLAGNAFNMEKVTLQPCGVSSKTVWIVDTVDQARITSAGVPLINGSQSNFSHPYVLNYPRNGFPTDTPRPQLFVGMLTGSTQPGGIFPVIGTINSNQLWSAVTGVLH